MGIGSAVKRMAIWKRIGIFLSDPASTKYLIVFLVISSSIFAYFGSQSRFPDELHYIALADSILVGKYTAWPSLAIYLPDTLRTFGYPSFLALFRFFTQDNAIVLIVQYVLYLLSIYLIGKRALSVDRTVLNGFLILATFNIQIPYYAGQISSEMVTIFLVALWAYIELSGSSGIRKIAYSSLILALLFMMKPAFLYFQLVYWGYHFLRYRKAKELVISMAIYGLGILPFGLFNVLAHDTMKLTPLEGGAGVVHIGFWQHKLPGMYDDHYWPHNMGTEPIKFIKEGEFENNRTLYNTEWERIDAEIKPYFTREDQIADSLMTASGINLFRVRSSSYTNAREQALKKSAINSIKSEPIYYLKTRAYTAMRQWVTGINLRLLAAPGMLNKVKALVPFVITFCTFAFGFPFLIYHFLRDRNFFREHLLLVFLVAYTGIIHVPMSIQSRYTVPVHLLVLFLVAIVISGKLIKKQISEG